jgi:hypothetical protein
VQFGLPEPNVEEFITQALTRSSQVSELRPAEELSNRGSSGLDQMSFANQDLRWESARADNRAIQDLRRLHLVGPHPPELADVASNSPRARHEHSTDSP